MAQSHDQNQEGSDARIFGLLVRERRKVRGWSQEALAAEAFANQDRKGYVSRIENGKVPNITRETVRSIARALRIDSEAIPSALRWPEATEVVKDTNEIVRETQSQIRELLSRRDNEVREFGVNEGMLVALAHRYSRDDLPGIELPGDFRTALRQLEFLLEQNNLQRNQTATKDASDQLPQINGVLQFLGQDVLREMLEGAIMARDKDTLESLLAGGVDFEDKSIAYDSALEFLLEEREPDETDTILELMDLFFAYGADINQICMHGSSLAHSVAYVDDGVRLLDYLLQKGIDVNRQGWAGQTALACAAGFGVERAVALLLEHGADPNIPDEEGWTPLIEASSLRAMGPPHDDEEEDRRIRVCEMLIKNGAGLLASTRAGETAAIEAKESEFFKLHEVLVRWSGKQSTSS